MPTGPKVTATLMFLLGQQGVGVQLESLGLTGNNLNEEIRTTGAFLQSIGGTLSHIAEADPTPMLFHGQVVITAGPQVDVKLPSWAGGEVTGSLVQLSATADIDKNHLTATGAVSVANGLALGADATATLDWNNDLFSGNGDFNLLNRTVVATVRAVLRQTADSLSLDRWMGSATIQLPPIFPAPSVLLLSTLGQNLWKRRPSVHL